MSESSAKSQKLMYIFGAVTTVVLGIGWFMQKKSNDSKKREENEQSQPEPHIIQKQQSMYQIEQKKPQLLEQANQFEGIKTILDSIKIDFPNINSKEFVFDTNFVERIFLDSVTLAGPEYKNLTIQNRLERRQLMKTDLAKYEAAIQHYNQKVEDVLNDAQIMIITGLGISQEQFEHNVLQLMDKGFFQQIYMMQANIRQKIKEKLPSRKENTIEMTKEVLRYQIQIIKEKSQFLTDMIERLENNQNMTPVFLNTIFQDLIYQKYQIEEEDQMKKLSNPELLNDPDIHIILADIQQAMYQLLGVDEKLESGQYNDLNNNN